MSKRIEEQMWRMLDEIYERMYGAVLKAADRKSQWPSAVFDGGIAEGCEIALRILGRSLGLSWETLRESLEARRQKRINDESSVAQAVGSSADAASRPM